MVSSMKDKTLDVFENLFKSHSDLEEIKENINRAFKILKQCYSSGGKVLVCGNGGSAADAEHIVGELMKGFMHQRKIPNGDIDKLKVNIKEDWEYFADCLQCTLPAISLVSQTAIFSAITNDLSPDLVFAQQVYGYGKEGDVLIALSTSGNSKNIINAIKVAKAFGIITMGFTGRSGGMLCDLCDLTIQVPSDKTYRVQEYHLPIYHTLCAMLEVEMFAG